VFGRFIGDDEKIEQLIKMALAILQRESDQRWTHTQRRKFNFVISELLEETYALFIMKHGSQTQHHSVDDIPF